MTNDSRSEDSVAMPEDLRTALSKSNDDFWPLPKTLKRERRNQILVAAVVFAAAVSVVARSPARSQRRLARAAPRMSRLTKPAACIVADGVALLLLLLRWRRVRKTPLGVRCETVGTFAFAFFVLKNTEN